MRKDEGSENSARLSPLEWKRGILLFIAFFICIFAILFTRPLRSALVLEFHSPAVLPTLWIWTGVIMFIWVLVFNRLLRRFDPEGIFVGSVAVCGAVLFGIQKGLSIDPGFASQALYVWNDVASIIVAEQIWSLLDDYFNEEQAKRVFGPIGAGGIIGGVLGAWFSTKMIGFDTAIGLVRYSVWMMVALIVPAVTLAYGIRSNRGNVIHRKFDHKRVEIRRGFVLIRDSRFLQLLAASVLLVQITSNIVDLQFNSYINETIRQTNERSLYIGNFLMWMNLFSVFLMLGLPSWLLRKFGVRTGLLILPTVNAVASVASLIGLDRAYPAAKFTDKSFNYSIQRASKEVLYIPIRPEDRFQVKPILDVFFYRMSETVAAFLVIPFLRHFTWHRLSALTLAICGLQVIVVFAIFRALKRHELDGY